MSDRVVIDGDMSLTSTIDGEGNAVIHLGENPVIEPLEVTANGTYAVPDGVDGFNPVTVDTGLALLATIKPQVGQKNCKIDLDNAWLSKYKHFVIICDIRITPASAEEWVYYTCNNQGRPSGRFYSVPTSVKNTGRFQKIVIAMVDDNIILLPNTGNTLSYVKNTILASGNYLNIGLYTYNYSEGTTAKIYGIV